MMMSSAAIVVLVTVVTLVHSVQPLEFYPHSRNEYSSHHPRDATDGFLPRNVWPIHYNLEIAPDFYQGQPPFTSSGSVQVVVRVTEPSNSIVLNLLDLSISLVSVVPDPANEVMPPTPVLLPWVVDRDANFLTLPFSDNLIVGALYKITIAFSGQITASSGLRYESYVDTDGSTKYLVTTQFQAIAARQMFPCFDESDMKATFNVTVLSRPPAVTLANMPLVATEDRAGGWVAHIFQTSPIMSSYQVCLAVGDFVFVESDWQGVTTSPVRIYGRPQVASLLTYTANAAPKIQAWFDEDTGIPYNLPKLDHIAFPIQNWAMENWGLITYGEFICFDDEVSSVNSIASSIRTVSHEIAHQWYGNLVTMKTWTDTWLNEGFATYMQYYGMQGLGWPGSEFQQIDSSGPQQFMETDQTNSSLPIRKEQQNIWQSDSMSAVSTYPKGGAMGRQLRGILSGPTFRQGLSNYLTKYSYSVASTDDLWEELNAQAAIDGITMPDGSPLDLKPLMDAWLDQWGYPLVSVRRNGDGTATLTASQYIKPKGQTNNISSAYNYRWNIPVTVLTKDSTNWDPTPSFWLQWLETGNPVATLPGVPNAGEWFMINVKQMFFYRVDYDSSILNDITNQLITDHTVIPGESRCQLIDDAFTLSRSLDLPLTLAMDTTLYLKNELFYNPWSATIKHTRYLDYLIQSSNFYTNYRAYMVQQLEPVYQQQGWVFNNTNNPLEEYMRRDINFNSCFFGLTSCINTALDEYQRFTENPDVNSIQPDNLNQVICTGVSRGTVDDWLLVFQQYQRRRDSMFSSERFPYLLGLACTSDTFLLDRLLSYVVEGTQIAPRDHAQALAYMDQNAAGRRLVWDYLVNSWTTVPSSINKVGRLREIVYRMSNQSEAEEFYSFINMYPPQTESEANEYAMLKLNLQQNLDWLNANREDLALWLTNHVTPAVVANLQAPLPVAPMDYNLDVTYDYALKDGQMSRFV